MALKTNLVSYWKLDESSTGVGAVTREDAHSTNDLTDNNTTASGTGKINNGADFEASNSERLSIADASQSGLDITGDFSISLWASVESFSGDRTLVAKWLTTGNQRAYRFLLESNTSVRVDNSTDGTAANTIEGPITTATINTGTFYHWVISVSGGTASLYRNGSLVSTASIQSSNFNSSAEFTIGAIGNPTNYFDGIIDEVAIWSRAITSDEVTEIYNGGSGLSYDSWDVPDVTPVDVTKSLQYTIRKAIGITKSAQYAIKKPIGITKSLQYTILDQNAVTKSAQYTIITDHEVTKSAQYAVKTVGAITKGLQYTIKQPEEITKGAQYTILTSDEVALSSMYTIRIPHEITKSLQYTIRDPNALTKSAQYTILTDHDVTLGLSYRVRTEAEITKSLQYAIRDPNAITKTAQYTVTTTSAITKGLTYRINLPDTDIQKSLQYAVKSEQAITLGLQYVIHIPHNPYRRMTSPFGSRANPYSRSTSPFTTF